MKRILPVAMAQTSGPHHPFCAGCGSEAGTPHAESCQSVLPEFCRGHPAPSYSTLSAASRADMQRRVRAKRDSRV